VPEPTDRAEVLSRASGAIASSVGLSAILSPRLLLRAFGIAPNDVTGAAAFGWRLFGVRTLAVGASAYRGDEAARAAILPVQIADQAVFAHALRTGAVPRRSAALAMAVSGVLIVLDLLARGDR